jgi:tetratricopeptide (TPR) repeat protein
LRLWSESYDEEFTDIFKLQDKLASEIAGALRPSLGEASEPIAHAPPTKDVEAYRLYLQGVRLKEVVTKQNYVQALELFSKAVVRDPKFARAYGELAETHLGFYMAAQPQEHLAEAEKLARKALTFGQETRALDVLAAVSLIRGHWLEMEGHDQVALASESTNAITLLHRAYHLAAAGKLRAAVEASRKANEIAPADPRVIGGLAEDLALLGEDEEAGKFANLGLQTGLKADPGLVYVYARAARKAGQYAKAADVIIDYIDVFGAGDEGARSKEIVHLVHAALADKRQRAAALAARARLYPPNRRVSASANAYLALYYCFASAQMYVLLDAIDDAYSLGFQCLDEQPPSGAPGAAVHRQLLSIWSPEMRPFRRDPRFQGLMTRIGLMEYWKQYGPPDDCDLKNGKLTCH